MKLRAATDGNDCWGGGGVSPPAASRRRRLRTTSFWLSYKTCICYIGAGGNSIQFSLSPDCIVTESLRSIDLKDAPNVFMPYREAKTHSPSTPTSCSIPDDPSLNWINTALRWLSRKTQTGLILATNCPGFIILYRCPRWLMVSETNVIMGSSNPTTAEWVKVKNE